MDTSRTQHPPKKGSSHAKIIRSYYGFQFFFNLLLWVPVFYEVQKISGLSAQQIFSIQAIYYLSFVLFEIPTGFIADRLGYKSSLVGGSGLLIFANAIPSFIPTHPGFLTHFLLIAAARSLISGAASALLYEYLKNHPDASHSKKMGNANNKQKASIKCLQTPILDYKLIEGRARSLGLLGKVVCWSATGWLMQIYLFAPYLVSCLTALFAGLYALRLPNTAEISRIENNKTPSNKDVVMVSIYSSIKQAIKELSQNRILLLLMLQGLGLFVLTRINQVMLFQPILTSKGVDIQYFGLIMSAMTLMEAVGSANSKSLERYIRDIPAIYALTVILALTLIVTAMFGATITAVGFLIFSFSSGLAFPIQRKLLNEQIKDKQRATVLSIESVINRMASAAVVLPLGGIVAAGEIDTLLLIAAAVAILAVTIVNLIIRKTPLNPTKSPTSRPKEKSNSLPSSNYSKNKPNTNQT